MSTKKTKQAAPQKTAADPMATLIAAAHQIREKAYAPYSRYHVGSAVLADNGKIYQGANVENASYGLSICAERNAVSAAILDGARRILACAVVTASDPPAAPCGVCRQTLAEFAPRDRDVQIALVNGDGKRRDTMLSTLLPMAFLPEDLE
ncbi:MAG: cytidine deaminase [Polyangia bacterium]